MEVKDTPEACDWGTLYGPHVLEVELPEGAELRWPEPNLGSPDWDRLESSVGKAQNAWHEHRVACPACEAGGKDEVGDRAEGRRLRTDIDLAVEQAWRRHLQEGCR